MKRLTKIALAMAAAVAVAIWWIRRKSGSATAPDGVYPIAYIKQIAGTPGQESQPFAYGMMAAEDARQLEHLPPILVGSPKVFPGFDVVNHQAYCALWSADGGLSAWQAGMSVACGVAFSGVTGYSKSAGMVNLSWDKPSGLVLVLKAKAG